MTDVRLSVSVDADAGRRNMQAFRAGYQELVAQLRQPLGQIGAFRDLQASLVQNEEQLNATRQRVRELRDELVRTEKPTRDQQNAYKAATAEALNLEMAISNQRSQLSQLSTALRGAGVDTNKLAGEQKRLAADMAQASNALAAQDARIAAARSSLGVRPHRDIRAEITGLQRDYQLLSSTGQLTTAELAQAKVRLRERVAELQQGTNGWVQSLSDARVAIGAAAAGMGAMIYAGSGVLNFYAQYRQQIAAIDSITNMSRAQLQGMSDDVRSLAVAMGRDAVESAAALNDALSSGVAEADGIKVLELATKAAIAGLTQTSTAMQGGLAVVNAYGEGIDNLELRFDQMFLAVRDGVVSFEELSRFVGDALPSARAAGVGFDEVAAAIARMTVAGIRAPQATTALKGAINALAAPTPEAAKLMKEYGIEWRGLVGTLEDIAALDLDIGSLRALIPDVEARTAVMSLTQDIGAMRDQVEAMRGAGGAMEDAYAKFADTPQAELDKFNASWSELKLQLGEAATAFLPLVELARDAITTFNQLPDPIRNTIAGLAVLATSVLALRAAKLALMNPMTLLLGHLSATPAAAGGAAQGMSTVAGAATSLIPKLRTLGDVAKLAKGALALGVVSWTAGNLAELYELHQQHQELIKSQKEYEQALSETIARTTEYADAVVLPAETLARMTETERNAYAERLRLAEEHYRKLAELTARHDTQRDGVNAPVSAEALAAAKRASTYRNALRQMQDSHKAREAAERQHGEAIARIKADGLRNIQDALGKELLAYANATKALERENANVVTAMKARAALAKEFGDLVKEMQAPVKTGPNTFTDVMTHMSGARQSLSKGDTENTIRQAREAAEILRELKAAGANSYGFAGIAKELAKLADEAGRLDEMKATDKQAKAVAELAAIKAKMDELLQQAEALKRVNIEFSGFEQSAAALEAQAKALAERLKKYMVIPVNYLATENPAQVQADKQAAGILGIEPVKRAAGGWVDGPGSPTSDSVLLAASRREFVVKASSAARIGAANLAYMNSTGQLPAREQHMPSFPDLPQSLDRMGERQPLNLAMPWGGSYALTGTPSEVERFSRDLKIARLKFGGSHD